MTTYSSCIEFCLLVYPVTPWFYNFFVLNGLLNIPAFGQLDLDGVILFGTFKCSKYTDTVKTVNNSWIAPDLCDYMHIKKEFKPELFQMLRPNISCLLF